MLTLIRSCVVQDLLGKSSRRNREKVAYFYCDATSRKDHLQGAETCLRSLVMQLVQFHAGKLSDSIIELWNKKPSGSLTAEECATSIDELSESSIQATIIIDALDEYETPELRESLLFWLRTIIENARYPVKIFVSSRNLRDIEAQMDDQSPSTVDVEVGDCNKDDLEKYIKKALGELIRSGKLLGGFEETGKRGLVTKTFNSR